jgi:hypothetical protein
MSGSEDALLRAAYFACEEGFSTAAATAELAREFPTRERAEIDSACVRADALIQAACEGADQLRGPNNDFKGTPTIDVSERCPGFSEGVYSDAEAWGLYLTK